MGRETVSHPCYASNGHIWWCLLTIGPYRWNIGPVLCGPMFQRYGGVRPAGGGRVADLGITGLVLQESPVLIGDHGAFGDPRGDRQGGNADAGTVEGAAEPADGSGRIRRGRGRRNVVVGVAMLVEDQPGNA